jgi:hypothetical protein
VIAFECLTSSKPHQPSKCSVEERQNIIANNT